MSTKAFVDLPNGTYVPVNAALVFAPGTTVAHDLTTTPIASVAVTAGTILRFSNPSANLVYLAFGTSGINGTITAATAMDLLPGSVECFTVPAGATHFSAMTATSTATIKRTTGLGA